MGNRVVITGLGVVSPLGVGFDALWAGLLERRSGLRPITRFDPAGFPIRVAGEVEGIVGKDFVPKSYRKATKVMARDTELAVAAAKLAVEHAGIFTRGSRDEESTVGEAALTYSPHRMGCHIGAGLISAEADEMAAALSTAREESGEFSMRRWGGEGGAGMESLTPLWMLKYLPNMLACHVTIIHGTEGPSNTITCAEASGLLSIGESLRVMERGAADLCFSGGAESKINLMGFLRVDLAGRLAHAPDESEGWKLVRPFEQRPEGSRQAGGVIGEGGGILVLENLATARTRKARILAEIVGFGAGQSGPYYEAHDDPGYQYAILNALDDAQIRPDQVSAIVPLGSGMAALDRPEAIALRSVFGARIASIPLVTIAPNIGNCFAGAGGLQAAVAAWCLHTQSLPPRLHAGAPSGYGAQMDAGATAPGARPTTLEYVLVCSGSLGGQNAAVVLKRGETA